MLAGAATLAQTFSRQWTELLITSQKLSMLKLTQYWWLYGTKQPKYRRWEFRLARRRAELLQWRPCQSHCRLKWQSWKNKWAGCWNTSTTGRTVGTDAMYAWLDYLKAQKERILWISWRIPNCLKMTTKTWRIKLDSAHLSLPPASRTTLPGWS